MPICIPRSPGGDELVEWAGLAARTRPTVANSRACSCRRVDVAALSGSAALALARFLGLAPAVQFGLLREDVRLGWLLPQQHLVRSELLWGRLLHLKPLCGIDLVSHVPQFPLLALAFPIGVRHKFQPYVAQDRPAGRS